MKALPKIQEALQKLGLDAWLLLDFRGSNAIAHEIIVMPQNIHCTRRWAVLIPAIGEIQGMMWKGKADIITDDCIIDLKTTSDINKFKWSAKSYNYDSQCYIYQTLFGKPLVFYVIDKLTRQLGIYTPTENFILGGEQKVGKAIEVYKKYFSSESTENIDNYFVQEELF